MDATPRVSVVHVILAVTQSVSRFFVLVDPAVDLVAKIGVLSALSRARAWTRTGQRCRPAKQCPSAGGIFHAEDSTAVLGALPQVGQTALGDVARNAWTVVHHLDARGRPRLSHRRRVPLTLSARRRLFEGRAVQPRHGIR
jgi:hypothetical protein